MTAINIIVSRHATFYSPLIATIAGGFLAEEGFEPTYGVATAEKSARDSLADGSAQLIQSAVSASWGPLDRGETSDIVHFAQINLLDGFFLTGREPAPDFAWSDLEGRTVLADHGGQPFAMFRYALLKEGIDESAINLIDAGDVDSIDAAFRGGQGDFVHQQGPRPQQLAADGVGHVVASVGAAIGPVAFSSLCATRAWLETDMAQAFARAYVKARRWVNETPAADIAAAEAEFFPDIEAGPLAAAIKAYQGLGCWDPAIAIPRDAYEVALDVFAHSGKFPTRHPYDTVVADPPATGG